MSGPEELTDMERRYLQSMAEDPRMGYAPMIAKALRMLDQVTVDRDDWLQVSRDWRIRAESAEQRVRELTDSDPSRGGQLGAADRVARGKL